jgi:hypothetical protein
MGRGETASVLEPLKKVLQIRRWKDARNNVQAVIQSLTQHRTKTAFLEVQQRKSAGMENLKSMVPILL